MNGISELLSLCVCVFRMFGSCNSCSRLRHGRTIAEPVEYSQNVSDGCCLLFSRPVNPTADPKTADNQYRFPTVPQSFALLGSIVSSEIFPRLGFIVSSESTYRSLSSAWGRRYHDTTTLRRYSLVTLPVSCNCSGGTVFAA